MGTQETIIYLLFVRNPSYDDYFSVLIFWAAFDVNKGVATKLIIIIIIKNDGSMTISD